MNVKTGLTMGLWLMAYAVAAAALALSDLNEQHISDSLVLTLESQQHWRFYMWEQDRVGTLIPLLISGIEDPFAALMTQMGLTCFFALALPHMLARLLCPTPIGAVAAVLANVWLLLAAPLLIHENQFVFCMYSTGLFLGICGLLVLEPLRADHAPLWRWLLAIAFMALAMWTYIAVVVLLLPLTVVHRWIRSGICFDRRTAIANCSGAIVTLLGFAIGRAGMSWFNDLPPFSGPTESKALPMAEWPEVFRELLRVLVELDGGPLWIAGTLAALAIFGTMALRHAPRDRGIIVAAALLLMLALVEIGFCSTRWWTVENKYSSRYLIGGIAAVPLATALLMLAPLGPWLGRRSQWLLAGVGLVALLAAVMISFGTPSPSRSRSIIDRKFGTYSQDVIDSQAHAIGGHYWRSWATFYHVRLLQHDRGEAMGFAPVGLRSNPFYPNWQALPQPFVVAVPRGDFEATNFDCIIRGLEPLVYQGSHGTLELYTTRVKIVP